MRKTVFLMPGILILMSVACSVSLPVIETSPKDIKTMNISINPPLDDTITEVSIVMGAGKLNIQRGVAKLIEGSITYNVPQWEPVVEQSNQSIKLKQSAEGFNFSKLPIGEYRNEWELKLGAYPINFELQAGAYDGALDFSSIPLTGLAITDGASSAQVIFNSPNPAQMEQLSYKTGASNVTLSGLSNANFQEMVFVGGAGDYTLDFSGALQHEATVDIESGVSSLEIVIPQGLSSKVIVSGNMIDTSTKGLWMVEDDTYYTEGTGPLLTIQVNTNLGSLTLIHE